METILIADDDAALRVLVRATLESVACSFVEAANGVEAWELLHQHRPMLAILDHRMPGISGLELLRAIRADPNLRTMRVILFTAGAHEAAAMAAGVDTYLPKPFSPVELVALVRQALGVSEAGASSAA